MRPSNRASIGVTVATVVEPLTLPAAEDAAPTPRGRTSPAIVLAPLAVALAVFGLVDATDGGTTSGDVVRVALICAWALAGGALVASRRQAALGTVVLLVAVVAGVCSATAEPDGAVAVVHRLGLGLLPAAGLHLLLALPAGHLDGARRQGVLAGYVTGLAVGIGLQVGGAPPPWWPVIVESATFAAIGLPVSNARYRTTRGLDRQRLQWVGMAVAVVAEAALVLGALRLLLGGPHHWLELAAAATVLIPFALAAGASTRLVTRVDRLLVHTVSVAGLTGVVVAVYLVVVVGLGRVPSEDERSLFALSMAAAAVAALLYLPAREWLGDTANRLVYGERQAPDESLRTFGNRLSRAIPMDELLLQLAESLRKTMALQAAEVWTGTGGRLDRAVSVPDRGEHTLSLGGEELPVLTRAGVVGNAWCQIWVPALLAGRGGAVVRVAPVSHSGELLGLLVVERPADGDAYTEEEERVLTELARQVGLALHNVQLDSALQESLEEVRRQAEELRASRARIVTTADAERRKIERNLHDGAQQHLVALAVNLRLTRDLLADDPETAAEMLEELGNSVKETIAELRNLAHGIYPPLLVDSGLPEALRAAAGRSPLAVSVEAEGVGRYPTELEAAVYFCVLEALQNAGKHAPDATVTVRVSESPGRLTFEVKDDGPGFDVATKGRGQGFTNMSDRVGAYGGVVHWESAPGQGTCISGEVPLAPVAAELADT
jgi:signal transduction histidine kinase